MKNNKWLLFIILVSIFLIPKNVLAYYNGSGVSIGSSSAGADCATPLASNPTKLCNYNNTNSDGTSRHNTVLVTLYYYTRNNDGSYSKSQVSDSKQIILTSNKAAAYLGNVTSPAVYEVGTLTYDNVISVLFKSENNVITDMNEPYKTGMGINNVDLSKPSAAPSMNSYGYRIVIEPMLSVEYIIANTTTHDHAVVTVKEAARIGLTNNNRFHNYTSGGYYHAIKLYTDTDDVGISKIACKGCVDAAKAMADAYKTGDDIREAVANVNIGFGYNIVDIPDSWKNKKCYGYKVGTNKLPKCDRKNSGSFGYIEQALDIKEVKSTESCPKNYSETPVYGKTMYEKNGKCKIQCIETAKELFPGSYGKIVNIGDLLVWPTDSSHKKTIGTNAFKISFSGELACTVTGSDRNACKSYIEKLDKKNKLYEFYKFESGVTLSYNDGEKNKSEKLTCTDIKDAKLELKDYTSTTTIYGESADTFKITASKISCKLPTNYNRYIDKETNKTSSTKSSNYVDVGYSNLRTSKNAKAGTYNLSLIDIKLGFENQFGSYANKKAYTCHYTMNSGNDTYKCPEGTKHSGMDLSTKMEDEKITYAEAVEKYCNSDDSCVCPADSDFEGTDLYSMVTENKSCSKVQEENCYTACYDSQGKKHSCKGYSDLESCTKALCSNGDSCYTADGTEVSLDENNCSTFNSKSACISHFCPPVPQEEHPHCYTPDGVKIYLTACIAGGKSEKECSKICDKNSDKYKCKNTNGVGGEMDITACVQTKMGQGLSLNEAIDACDSVICPLGKRIIYRVIDLSNPFPSYNADATVAQTGLNKGMFNDNLKGRYPGTNWNNKTTVKREILNNRNVDGDKVYDSSPMYVFTLDSNTIKAIRKYNKTTTYDDFNLSCKLNNSTACVSSFVHNRAYGLTGGVYSGTLTKTSFYSHDNKSN